LPDLLSLLFAELSELLKGGIERLVMAECREIRGGCANSREKR